MFSLITTIISIALAVGVTGATMYYLGSATDEGSDVVAAAELLTQSEQIAAAIDMRAFQQDGLVSDLSELVTGKYLLEVPTPPSGAFVSEVPSASDWQVPQAHERPVVLVTNKIKASVCAAFNNKMLSDASIPAQANPALRIQCYGAAEPYSLVINPQMTRAPLEAVLQPDPDAALPQTVALSSANLCFKQGVAGSFDFKTVFSASQEPNPTMAEVVWSASGTVPAGLNFDAASGVLSGIPTETVNGDYTVTASYKNAEGQQVYKLLVKGSELEAIQISGGNESTCVVTPKGGVRCWGYNNYGQLGDGTINHSLSPVQVTGLTSGVRSIEVGNNHACAILNTGRVRCWGLNANGQLGTGTTRAASTPSPVEDVINLNDVTSITFGASYTCAITAGKAFCWGYNSQKILGTTDTNVNVLSPSPVAGLPEEVKNIASGSNHLCAITVTGVLYCWGINSSGQVGINSVASPYTTPRQVYGVSGGVSDIYAGSNTTCAVINDITYCWGANSYGEFGMGSKTYGNKIPVQVPWLMKKISIGFRHVCGITLENEVQCWGNNPDGQLGDGTVTDSLIPKTLPGLGNEVVDISAGYYHTCVTTNNGYANCWGKNNRGQIGLNTTSLTVRTPSKVLDLLNTESCTNFNLYARDTAGTPSISGTISLTPATLPVFRVRQAATYNFAALYKDSLNPSPNMVDVTWSGVGTVPPGLMLDPVTGELFGTPTSAASASYTVKATYKGSNSGQQTYQVVVR